MRVSCSPVSDRVVLVWHNVGHSRRSHILRLESAAVRTPSASVQEPHGLDDILGRHGHADFHHVFRRLRVDIQVRVKMGGGETANGHVLL